MNKHARLARRILRDHRRNPRLYSHTRMTGPFHTNWICPRCAGSTIEQLWLEGNKAIPRSVFLIGGRSPYEALIQYLKEGQTEA